MLAYCHVGKFHAVRLACCCDLKVADCKFMKCHDGEMSSLQNVMLVNCKLAIGHVLRNVMLEKCHVGELSCW
jgi:hypothetical protein